MCVQIILYFSAYVLLYRIYSDSQVGTSSLDNIKGVNETIDLDHNVEGLEMVSNLPWDILKALNRKSEGSKPNVEELEVINLAEEGEKEKPVKIGVNFPKDMKDELIALMKEFKEIFVWSYQDMTQCRRNRGDKPSWGSQDRKTHQDQSKLSQGHERWAYSSNEGIQRNHCLVLSRYARTGYRDCCP